MLNIREIENGLVLDHIEAGLGDRILKVLKLDNTDYAVALLKNVVSQKFGKKDIIKIDEISIHDIDLKILGLIDPNITVNVIEGGKKSGKVKLNLPDAVVGVFHCNNPRCVTMVEETDTTFHLVNAKTREYKCEFCDSKVTMRKK